jgi:hypothetical protein
MKVKLERLSVCVCGFPTLKETIPLGTEYEVDSSRVENLGFICGGCGRKFDVAAIFVHSRTGGAGGYVPKQIFETAN